jgi:tetrahydromethanopterin S-methyltransferase subunit B
MNDSVPGRHSAFSTDERGMPESIALGILLGTALVLAVALAVFVLAG